MKRNVAFKSGNHHGNVVLNYHQTPKDDFASYAEACHEAGMILANET